MCLMLLLRLLLLRLLLLLVRVFVDAVPVVFKGFVEIAINVDGGIKISENADVVTAVIAIVLSYRHLAREDLEGRGKEEEKKQRREKKSRRVEEGGRRWRRKRLRMMIEEHGDGKKKRCNSKEVGRGRARVDEERVCSGNHLLSEFVPAGIIAHLIFIDASLLRQESSLT